jgi:hypothetical protein
MVILASFSFALSVLPGVCLFKTFFGVPCPACGITRNLIACFSGDIRQAWEPNAGGPLLAAAIVLQNPLRLLVLQDSIESDVVARAGEARE